MDELNRLIYQTNQLLANALNRIMHNKDFQHLEANWLQLYHLLNNATQTNYHVYINAINTITSVIECDQLLNLCYEKRYQMPGGMPFSILALLYNEPLPYERLNRLAEKCFVPIIIASTQSQTRLPSFIYTLAPQVLLRIPYQIESTRSHSDLLWGNPCFYFLELILNRKPFYTCHNNRIFRYINAASHIQDIFLLESTFEQTHNDSAKLSIISLMTFCRFVHCLKIQLRDKLGQFCTKEECQQQLQTWIHRYCSQMSYKNHYPLKHAKIKIIPSMAANSYICSVDMALHAEGCAFTHSIEFTMEHLC